MGRRGTRPEPGNLRALKGDPGKRRKTPRAPIEVRGVPEKPRDRWFTKTASEEWDRVVAVMVKRQTISPDNRSTLIAYCCAYSDLISARRELARSGMFFTTSTGYRSQAPAVAIAKQASERVQRLAIELGLTPASRDSVPVTAGKSEDEEFEEWRSKKASA